MASLPIMTENENLSEVEEKFFQLPKIIASSPTENDNRFEDEDKLFFEQIMQENGADEYTFKEQLYQVQSDMEQLKKEYSELKDENKDLLQKIKTLNDQYEQKKNEYVTCIQNISNLLE